MLKLRCTASSDEDRHRHPEEAGAARVSTPLYRGRGARLRQQHQHEQCERRHLVRRHARPGFDAEVFGGYQGGVMPHGRVPWCPLSLVRRPLPTRPAERWPILFMRGQQHGGTGSDGVPNQLVEEVAMLRVEAGVGLVEQPQLRSEQWHGDGRDDVAPPKRALPIGRSRSRPVRLQTGDITGAISAIPARGRTAKVGLSLAVRSS